MEGHLRDADVTMRGARSAALLLCISSGVCGVAQGQARAITLDDALVRTETDSPSGLAIKREVERAEAERRAAGLWPNPAFTFSQEDSGSETEQITDVSLGIPIGGRLALERMAAQSGLRGAEARARQARIELRATVRDAFFELLRFQERTGVLEGGMDRFEELVKTLRAREHVGESSGFDRMRAEREKAEVEIDLLESRQGLFRARSVLAALAAIPAAGLVAEGSLLARGALPPKEELRAAAMSRGDLVSLEAEAERAERLARAARRRLIPEPVLVAGTKSKQEAGEEESGPVFGISLALPIFDRGQGERAVARAESALLHVRREALQRTTEAELEAAYAEAVSMRQAEEAYSMAPNPADLARIAWAAYEGGEMGILELLDAHRLAVEVQLKLIDLHTEARRAEVALGRVSGAEVRQ